MSLVILLAAAACSNGTASPSDEPTQPPAPRIEATPGLQTVMATTDFGVGTNRVTFGLIDALAGPIREADVEVSTYLLTSAGAEGPKETVEAEFRKWPTGPGGVYTAQLSFDQAGTWGIGVKVVEADGSSRTSSKTIQVNRESASPAIGSPAPRSENKTARDVGSLEELTTDPHPDPDLYAMTVAEAIDSGKPLMVVFATPAYCESATCGPVVNVVKDIKQRYSEKANFIHIEVYDNPLEIQGDLRRARISPSLAEWGLPTEPWTFIVDGEGLVRAKFESFATREELEEGLARLLD